MFMVGGGIRKQLKKQKRYKVLERNRFLQVRAASFDFYPLTHRGKEGRKMEGMRT